MLNRPELHPAPVLLTVDDDTYLRRPVSNDARTTVAAVRDSQNFIGRMEPWAYSIHEDVERYYIKYAVGLAEKGEAAPYGLFYRQRFIGHVALHSYSPQGNYARLGYWRIDDPDVRGKGLVTRAARQVARVGLAYMGFSAVVIDMAPDNTASRHVAERLGATFVGRAENGNLAYVLTELDEATASDDKSKASW